MNQESNNQPNRGKKIYFKNEMYFIVYEFDKCTLITKSEDLKSGVFSVAKSQLSVKRNKE